MLTHLPLRCALLLLFPLTLHAAQPATVPTTTTAPTTAPASTKPTTKPSLAPEAQIFLDQAVSYSKGMQIKIPTLLKPLQQELAAAKSGVIQTSGATADFVRTVRPNGTAFFRFANPAARKAKVAEFQGKVDALEQQLADLKAGKLFIPSIDFSTPVENSAGLTNGRTAKVISILSRTQAVVGSGAQRYMLHCPSTADFVVDKAAPLPEWATVLGTVTHYDISSGDLKTLYVIKAVPKFDLEAEAARQAAAR